MKKLKLKNLKLEASDMLQRNELKTVFGGYGDGEGPFTTCYVVCGTPGANLGYQVPWCPPDPSICAPQNVMSCNCEY